MTSYNPSETLHIDEQLTLRQLQPDDANRLFELVDGDREYLGKWLPWVAGTRIVDDSKNFILSTQETRTTGSEYGYGVFEGDRLIGHITLRHLKDNETPEIGYWLASQAAGKGIVTKAVIEMTRIGHNVVGLKKIVILAQPDNVASNRVAEKCGYFLSGQMEKDGLLLNVWASGK